MKKNAKEEYMEHDIGNLSRMRFVELECVILDRLCMYPLCSVLGRLVHILTNVIWIWMFLNILSNMQIYYGHTCRYVYIITVVYMQKRIKSPTPLIWRKNMLLEYRVIEGALARYASISEWLRLLLLRITEDFHPWTPALPNSPLISDF